MKVEKRKVDLNAIIRDLSFFIQNNSEGAWVQLHFTNATDEVISALKFRAKGKNSFDDIIQIKDDDYFQLIAQDINLKSNAVGDVKINLPDSNIRKLELELQQVCFSDGKIVIPDKPDIVDYEIELLCNSWSSQGSSEKDALDYLKGLNSKAICYPRRIEKGWICTCGMLNKNTNIVCTNCGCRQVMIFDKCTEDIVNQKIVEKKEREQKEQEEKEAQRKRELEELDRKKKRYTKIGISLAVVAFISLIGMLVINNIKYRMPKEDTKSYKVALRNYWTLWDFSRDASYPLYDLASGYFNPDAYGISYMDEAKKNKEFVSHRAYYLETGNLFPKIEKQFPEKYQPLYERIAGLQKSYVNCDVSFLEKIYILNTACDYYDDEKAIDDEIDRMNSYLEKTVLNPNKIKYKDVKKYSRITTSDYEYGQYLTLSILFYDNDEIQFIGMIEDGVPNGFGIMYYSTEEKEVSASASRRSGILHKKKEGLFINGELVDGEEYSLEGDKKEIHDKEAIDDFYTYIFKKGPHNSVSNSASGSSSKVLMLA